MAFSFDFVAIASDQPESAKQLRQQIEAAIAVGKAKRTTRKEIWRTRTTAAPHVKSATQHGVRAPGPMTTRRWTQPRARRGEATSTRRALTPAPTKDKNYTHENGNYTTKEGADEKRNRDTTTHNGSIREWEHSHREAGKVRNSKKSEKKRIRADGAAGDVRDDDGGNVARPTADRKRGRKKPKTRVRVQVLRDKHGEPHA